MDEAFLYKGSGQNMLYSISTHLDQGTREKNTSLHIQTDH